MHNILTATQIPLGICLISLILLQAKGVGLGRTLSGPAYHSKRGIEYVIFRLTVILAVLFVICSITAQLII